MSSRPPIILLSGAESHQLGIALVRDDQACIPLTRILDDDDNLILLTPVVIPFQKDASTNRDPFEPFGRALAARHPRVHHLPYTVKSGITGHHIELVKIAKAVVFVISGAPADGQRSQVEYAEIARIASNHRPQMIVACHDVRELGLMESSFPTIIQLPGYSSNHLEGAAAVLFGETQRAGTNAVNVQDLIMAPREWHVEELDDKNFFDVSPILGLWNECLPPQFHLERHRLQRLLHRYGYCKHYVVKTPDKKELVGFCATYTTYLDGSSNLLGSVSMLIVKPSYRRRGIGLTLFENALDVLAKTQGVTRLQLGSAFPRLLCGVPIEFVSENWFKRRGWEMDLNLPGRGQEICDWLLRIQDWPSGILLTASGGFTFRQCTFDEFPTVMEFVREESQHGETMGMFGQYAESQTNFSDIVLGFHGKDLVATALIYIPRSGTQSDLDLPWASNIGFDVGGVTCVGIANASPVLENTKDSVMIRLLDTCIRLLQDQGMRHVFLDGIKGGDEGFQAMGFQKWARYRDVWRNV